GAEVGVQEEGDLGLRFRVDERVELDDAMGERHRVGQPAVVRLVDAHRLAHGLAREPELAADHRLAVGLAQPQALRLDRVGVRGRDLGPVGERLDLPTLFAGAVELGGELGVVQAHMSSTVPKRSKTAATLSPGSTATASVSAPARTVVPARRRSPRRASSVASQATAAAGCPSTAAPAAVATVLPLRTNRHPTRRRSSPSTAAPGPPSA